jgi:hypothetical protein
VAWMDLDEGSRVVGPCCQCESMVALGTRAVAVARGGRVGLKAPVVVARPGSG